MPFINYIKALAVGFAALVLMFAQPAAAQQGGSNIQQEIINSVIQNIIQNVRDQLMHRRLAVSPGALRFNGEEDARFDSHKPFTSNDPSNPFAALAYAKAPAMAPPPVSVWLYGANLVGSGDKSVTFGTDTHVATITGAFDVTKIGIFTALLSLSLRRGHAVHLKRHGRLCVQPAVDRGTGFHGDQRLGQDVALKMRGRP